ncbi:MAG: hypothetical protein DRI90_17530 [Deltaproteobacteria bacterium]|nr:MAG: hypothetical protein DRI90_17530 [Deltaproteobacteria bacterium]
MTKTRQRNATLIAVALFGVAIVLGSACSGEEDDVWTNSSSSSGSGGSSSSGTGGSSSSGTGGSSSSGTGGGGGQGAAWLGCDALEPATGNIIEVTPSQTAQLQSIVSSAAPGDTIAFADGTYDLNGDYLWITAAGLSLRSQSGNRDAVILDGNYSTTEIITVVASDVTIADLTIQRAYTHPIHVATTGGADTLGTLIYNVHIIDPRQQAIKINHNQDGGYPDNSVIACSHIELTDQERGQIDTQSTSCYTGGVDAHSARGWVIRDNLIEGFWCPTGLSEHGVHMWRGGRDTIVERNVFMNNARGVGFGMATSGTARTYSDDPCPAANGGYVGDYDGMVRNNFIFANDSGLLSSGSGFDCGICFWSACGAQAVHNTIVSTGDMFSAIEWRFATSTGVAITNNIVTHPLRERDGASATEAGNLENAQLSLFVDGANGNLHLESGASAAIDQGTALPSGQCDNDIDGDPRDDGQLDIGADEIP